MTFKLIGFIVAFLVTTQPTNAGYFIGDGSLICKEKFRVRQYFSEQSFIDEQKIRDTIYTITIKDGLPVKIRLTSFDSTLHNGLEMLCKDSICGGGKLLFHLSRWTYRTFVMTDELHDNKTDNPIYTEITSGLCKKD